MENANSILGMYNLNEPTVFILTQWMQNTIMSYVWTYFNLLSSYFQCQH